MGRWDVFAAQLDAEDFKYVGAVGTINADTYLRAEGTAFPMSSGPFPGWWAVGSIASITGGGKTAYCRITKYTTSPSNTVTLLPLQTTRDSAGVLDFQFPNGSSITTLGTVFQDPLSLVIDLTDAPAGETYNYVLLATASFQASTAAAVQAAFLSMSAPGDPLGGAESAKLGELTMAPLTGNAGAPAGSWIDYVTLTAGQRYEFRILLAAKDSGLCWMRHGRIVAMRYDSAYANKQALDTEGTTQSTGAYNNVVSAVGVPAGTYHAFASWMQALSHNGANDQGEVIFGDATNGIYPAQSLFVGNATTEWAAYAYVGTVTLSGLANYRVRHRVTAGSQSGCTSKVKNARIILIPTAALRVAFSLFASRGDTTVSGLTADAWNPMAQTNAQFTEDDGRWYIDILQVGNEMGQELRPRFGYTSDPYSLGVAGFEQDDRRGYWNGGQPAGKQTRTYCNFFIQRFFRHKMRGNKLHDSRLECRPPAATTSLPLNDFSGLFLRENEHERALIDDEVALVVKLEPCIGYRNWQPAGTDIFARTFADQIVSRIVVNKEDYSPVASVGVLAAKTFYFDLATRLCTIKMGSGETPSTAGTTVMVGFSILVSEDPEILQDANGIDVPYEPRLKKTPSVTERLTIATEGCEVAPTYGTVVLTNEDGAFDDAGERYYWDGYRVSAWRGRHSDGQRKLSDLQLFLDALMEGPSQEVDDAFTVPVQDAAIILDNPVTETLIIVYQGAAQVEDQILARYYGTIRRVKALRTTNNGSGSNTFKVASHACKNIGALQTDGTFQAKAYKDGDELTPSVTTITNDLTNGQFTVADSLTAYWQLDTLYVDVQGVTEDGTSSGVLVETPGRIFYDLVVKVAGWATDRVAQSTCWMLDHFWRLRRSAPSTIVPLPIRTALILTNETISEALTKVTKDVGAYWKLTRAGRIKVGVPELSAQNALVNSGIELDSASAWPFYGGLKGTLAPTTTIKYAGARAVVVTNNVYGDLRQRILLHRDGDWAFTAMVGLSSGPAMACRIGLLSAEDGAVVALSELFEIVSTEFSRVFFTRRIAQGFTGTAVPMVIPFLPHGYEPTYPGNLRNLKLWLRADRITGKSFGDPISQWDDQSGNGNHAVQATGSKQPTFYPNACCGYPGVFFDDKDDSLSTSLTLNQPCTVFVVYAYRSTQSKFRRVLSGSNNWLIGPYSNKHQAYVNSGFVPSTAQPAVDPYEFVVVALRQNSGTSSELWVNGVSVGTQGAGSQLGPGTLYLGVGSAFPAESAGNSVVCEVVAFDSNLSDTRLNAWNDALQYKYGKKTAEIVVDSFEAYPVAGVVERVEDEENDPAYNATPNSYDHSIEHSYVVRVPFNANQESPDNAPRATSTDMEARGILGSYQPTKSEGRASVPTSARIDFESSTLISAPTKQIGLESALGVAAPWSVLFSRPRSVHKTMLYDFLRMPEVGDLLFVRPSISRFGKPWSEQPMLTITEVNDTGDPAVEIELTAERDIDPLADRQEIASAEVPLGWMVVVKASACPTDHVEVQELRGAYIQIHKKADTTNWRGSAHHQHDLSAHTHVLAQHGHTAKLSASQLGGSVELDMTVGVEFPLHQVVYGPLPAGYFSSELVSNGPTSIDGDHVHSAGTGSFTMNQSTAGIVSSGTLAALATYNGSNDLKNMRVLLCRRVAKTVATISTDVMVGYLYASNPPNWTRETTLYNYALRAANPEITGATTYHPTSSHTPSDTANGGLGGTLAIDVTGLRIYQRVTISEGANTYHGRVTSVGVSSVTLAPSHETNDCAVDGTVVFTTSANVTVGDARPGVTLDPGTHLHVKSGANGNGGVAGHQHNAPHNHVGIASGAPTIGGASGAYAQAIGSETTGWSNVAPDGHTHPFGPVLPTDSSNASAQVSGNFGGNITSAATHAVDTYRLPFIKPSDGAQTQLPIASVIFGDATKCPDGYTYLTGAHQRILVAADSGEAAGPVNGTHAHGVDFAAHDWTHTHGNSFPYLFDEPEQRWRYIQQVPINGRTVATAGEVVYGTYQRKGHGHWATVGTIQSVNPTLQARNSQSTPTDYGSNPPYKRLIACVRL